MTRKQKLAWSCDDQKRASGCRNPHGCHCREITDLQHQVAALPPAIADQADGPHYLGAIRERLKRIYALSARDPRAREQISDEVSWIDEQIESRKNPRSPAAPGYKVLNPGEKYLGD